MSQIWRHWIVYWPNWSWIERQWSWLDVILELNNVRENKCENWNWISVGHGLMNIVAAIEIYELAPCVAPVYRIYIYIQCVCGIAYAWNDISTTFNRTRLTVEWGLSFDHWIVIDFRTGHLSICIVLRTQTNQWTFIRIRNCLAIF